MKTAKQRKLEDLRRGVKAMYAVYLEACKTKDKGQAAYAWEMYQRYDREIEQLEAK